MLLQKMNKTFSLLYFKNDATRWRYPFIGNYNVKLGQVFYTNTAFDSLKNMSMFEKLFKMPTFTHILLEYK